MANTTYQFSTITAAQAQTVDATDTIIFSAGPASAATVTYAPATALVTDQIVITYNGVTVSFAVGVALTAAAGNLVFPDSSQLFIGTFAAVNDTFTLPSSNDAMFGGQGDDNLNAGNGTNTLQGNQGNDTLTGGTGADSAYGGQDNDTIDAGAGTNFVNGNRGNDSITGGSGNEILLGGRDNDVVDGGDGE